MKKTHIVPPTKSIFIVTLLITMLLGSIGIGLFTYSKFEVGEKIIYHIEKRKNLQEFQAKLTACQIKAKQGLPDIDIAKIVCSCGWSQYFAHNEDVGYDNYKAAISLTAKFRKEMNEIYPNAGIMEYCTNLDADLASLF